MTDTPLKPAPVAWAERRELNRVKPGAARGCMLAKAPIIGDGWNFNVPLYTQDQLDAAVRAERERCATKAHGWLKNWAADLFGTWESYIEAKASGRHNGRRISEGDADMFAKQFRERAEAVDDCADHVAAAIREGE